MKTREHLYPDFPTSLIWSIELLNHFPGHLRQRRLSVIDQCIRNLESTNRYLKIYRSCSEG